MNLTEEQMLAVDEIEHHLQIIACAGSGKTEVIVRRIANILEKNQKISPEQIVAFTFTEKAASSMKARIRKLLQKTGTLDYDKIYVGTIHSFCLSILRKYSDQFEDFRVLDSVKSHLFVQRYHDKCGMSDLELQPYPRDIKLFLECIDKMVDDYDNYAIWNEAHRFIFDKYRSFLYEHKYFDFPLIIFEAIQQAEKCSTLRNYLSSLKYLIVDEYQDIDDMQEKLIRLLSGFGINICIVGDDDQTIYQFRGSNADNMLYFSDRYRDVRQVRLEKNFRCSDKIVDIADNVIKFNQKRIQKKMISKNVNFGLSYTTAKRFDSPDDEYDEIAKQISMLHAKGIPYSEMAVLVRKRKYINSICSALERDGIPYDSDSAEHFFSGKYFRCFVDTMQHLIDMDKAKLYECWDGIISRDGFNRGFRYLQKARRGGNGHIPLLNILFKGFIDNISFLQVDTDDIQERTNAVNAFGTILSDYDEIYQDQQFSARITGLLKFLEFQAADEYKYHNFITKAEGTDTVKVMTIHKSKGLEFNTVFLPDLEESVFPASKICGKRYWHILGGTFEENKDRFDNDIEDERKLFYVAVTRAKQNLFLYYELSKKNLSNFVKEAAQSTYLDIERADLYYRIPEKSRFTSNFHITGNTGYSMDKKEISQQQKEYREQMKLIRRKVLDYYGSAIHFFPAARIDYDRVKIMNDEELLEEARKLAII